MPKYRVYAILTASKPLGEFEADSPEAAEEMAMAEGNDFANICHQCAREIDLGDPYEYQVEEVG